MNDFPTATETDRVARDVRKQCHLPELILSKLADCIKEASSLGSSGSKYFLPKDEMEFQIVIMIIAFLREKHYGAFFIDVGNGKPFITIHW